MAKVMAQVAKGLRPREGRAAIVVKLTELYGNRDWRVVEYDGVTGKGSAQD
jgi:hypothetical protein